METLIIIVIAFAAGVAADHFLSTKIETAIQRVEAAVKSLKA